MKKIMNICISSLIVIALLIMHSSPIKAWSYTQIKTIYNNYISVYYWEFDYAATITYN